MTTVLEAFEAMGMALEDNETVCIVFGDEDFKEYSLEAVADREVGSNVYFSTGTFRKDQKWGKKGRTLQNVQRILELPFDFDLKDFLRQEKDDIYDLEDGELEGYIPFLQHAVEDVFARIHLPIHRLDYTGYGLSAHILLPDHDPRDVQQIKDWHAAIVTRINGLYGDVLADAQVKDAGPRIMRLIPCLNVGTRKERTKVQARQSRNIYMKPGYIDQALLEQAAGAISWKGVSIDIPLTGDVLTTEEMQTIVDAYKPFHTQGQKHYMGLAIAGQLGKARVPEEQALAIVTAISADDNKPWDRQKAVRDTYDKIRNGQIVTGYYVLRDCVSEEAIQGVDRILERVRKKNESRLILISDRKNGKGRPDVKLFNPPPIPEEAFYGWHRRYLDLVYPTTGASTPFHLAASLTLQAAMMGRRISSTYAGSPVYPNQFVMVVGTTGSSFKDTAYNRSMEFVKNAKLLSADKTLLNTPFFGITDIASREAMVKMLSKQNNIYLFSTEISAIFKNASRESTSSLLDGLINVWDNPSVIQNSSLAAQENGGALAHDPTLNIYGGIQPSRMAEYMTETMITSGLGNRLAIFMGNGRGKLPRTPKLDVRASGQMYLELMQTIRNYDDGTEIEMNDAAGEIWDEWFLAIPEEVEEIANDMKVRYPVMVQKWALMFAVSDGAYEIDVPHIQAAMTLCDWMWACVKEQLPSWGVSVERKIEERVMNVLEQRQPISKRELTQYVRGKWTSREVAGVLRSLKETQQIAYSADDRYVSTAEFAEKESAGVA